MIEKSHYHTNYSAAPSISNTESQDTSGTENSATEYSADDNNLTTVDVN